MTPGKNLSGFCFFDKLVSSMVVIFHSIEN